MVSDGGAVSVEAQVVDGMAAEEEEDLLGEEELDGQGLQPDVVNDIADAGDELADHGEDEERFSADGIG